MFSCGFKYKINVVEVKWKKGTQFYLHIVVVMAMCRPLRRSCCNNKDKYKFSRFVLLVSTIDIFFIFYFVDLRIFYCCIEYRKVILF